MKTIIARFQELKAAVSDSVEIDGELVEVNKVDTALQSVGVQLRDSLTGQFRDLDDVFLELASKWDTLDRNIQRYVATIAAGSRQQSRFIAMMDNYERTLELVDIAQNSSGASAEQFSKTLDSVEAKVNQIKSSFEEFIGTMVSNTLVKNVLTSVNSVIQVLNNIAEAGPVAFTAFMATIVLSIKRMINNIISGARTVSGAFKGISSRFSQDWSSSFKFGNKEGTEDLLTRLKGASIEDILAGKIKEGFRQGTSQGTNEITKQISTKGASSIWAKGKSANTIASSENQVLDYQYLSAIKARLKNNQTISNQDRLVLTKGGLFNNALGLSNAKLLEGLSSKNIKEKIGLENFGLSDFMNKHGKLFAQISSVGAMISDALNMAIISSSAQKGESALEGALAGQMIGSMTGALGNLVPVIGPVLGPLLSSIGSTMGSIIGQSVGTWIDNKKYGIGSEENISKLKENLEKIQDEANKVIEKNQPLIESGEEYLELNDKLYLTNEEKNRLIELNNELISQYPELASIQGEEIQNNNILISQLEKRIALAKEENAQAEVRSSVAGDRLDFAQAERERQKEREKLEKEIQSSQYPWWEQALNWVGAIGGAGVATPWGAFSINRLTEGYGRGEEALEFFNQEGLDYSSIKYQDYLDYYNSQQKDFLSESKAITEEQFFEIADLYREQELEIEEFLNQTDEYISTLTDAFLSNFDENSFVSQNKSFITSLINSQFDKEELEKLYRDPNFLEEDWINLFQSKIEEIDKSVVQIMENLGEDGQQALANALNMIGLFRENGEINLTPIKDYLQEELGDVEGSQVFSILEKISEEEIKQRAEAYNTLLENHQDFINKYVEQNKQLEAYAYANIAMAIGEESGAFIEAFEKNFENIENKLDTKNFSEFIDLLGRTKVEDSLSISRLAQSMSDLNLEETDVINLTNSLGSVFQRAGLDAEGSLEVVTQEFEKINEALEMTESAIEGSLSLENFNAIQDLLKDTGQEILSLKDVFVTEEGIGIYGGIEEQLGIAIENTSELMYLQAAQSKAAMQYKLNEINSLKQLNENWEDNEEILAEISRLEEEVYQYNRAYQNYALIGLQREISLQKQAAEAQKDRIKAAKEMLLSLERYYNLERQTLDLENKMRNFEIDFEIGSNSSQKADALTGQVETLIYQRSLLEKEGELYSKDLADLTEIIKDQYSDFFSVGEDGVLQYNYEGWENLAERMKNASGEDFDYLEKEQETLEKIKDSYEDIYDRVNDNTVALKENVKEVEELYDTMRDYIITIQETISDMYINNLEEELQAVKDKYSKIKEEDQKYLDSLQKSINKRKQMQSDADQDEEIETLQKRIGLLSRDTSGIYTKEIESLQEELDQLLREKSNTTLDRLYEEEQEKTQATSDELSRREEYLTQALEREKETHTLTNQFIVDLWKQGQDAILEYWKQNNSDYISGTEEQRAAAIESFKEDLNNAAAAQDVLYLNMDHVISESTLKYQNLKINTIDQYIEWMKQANEQELNVQVNTSAAEEKINNLISKFDELWRTETAKELDTLLEEIEDAAAEGNTELVKSLREDYARKLKQYQNYGGSVNDINTAGYGVGSGKGTVATGYGSADYYAQLAGEATKRNSTPVSTSSSQPSSKFKVGDKIKSEEQVRDGGINQVRSYWREGNSNTFESNMFYWEFGGSLDGKKIAEGPVKGADGYNYYRIPIAYNNEWFREEQLLKYATGGLVDYTGPAWVDGTKSKPEAFLSSSDTQNIANLRDVLSKVYNSPKTSDNISQNQNNGDTYYEFHITIEELGDKYTAEDMMEDMEKYILQKSNYRNVISIGRKK